MSQRKKIWYMVLVGMLCIFGSGLKTFAAEATIEQFTYTESYGVVTITDFADGLTEVNIGKVFPDAVEIVIGADAFRGNNITKVTIPKTVSYIKEYAFYNCTGLKTVVFEERTTEELTFETGVFYNCYNLTALELPDIVTVIPSKFCYNCSALQTVELPKNCQTIKASAFYGCGVNDIVIPETCTSIGASAFEESKLMNITIPETCASIGDSIFENCDGLTSINLPQSCKIIPASAFKYCDNLAAVTISKECISIGKEAFYYCVAFNQMNTETTGNALIPESCTSIGESAFGYCSNLKSVTFENPDTIIGKNAFGIPYQSKNLIIYCEQLGMVTEYATANDIAFVTLVKALSVTQLPNQTEYYYDGSQSLDTTGMKLEAEVEEKDGTTVKQEVMPEDCTFSGFKGNRAGNQTITVSYGGKQATFNVFVYYNFAAEPVKVEDAVYTGDEIIPNLKITSNESLNTTLTKNKDYVMTCSNNIHAGTASVTLTGMGNYKGEQTVTFQILPKELTAENTTVKVADMDYTGSQIKPVPEVMHGTKKLVQDEDYVITYGTNVNVGQGTVMIEGIGNYEGSIETVFNIKEEIVTTEVTTEEPTTEKVTSEGTTEVSTTEQGTSEVTTEVSTTEQGTSEGTTEVSTTEQGTSEVTTEVSTTEQGTSEATTEVSTTEQGTSEVTTEVSTTEKVTTEEASTRQPDTQTISTEKVPATEATTEAKTSDAKSLKGKIYTYKKLRYKVTSSTSVTFIGVANKKLTTLKIPDYIILSGRTYLVTKIGKKACYKNKKIKSVTVGKYVTLIEDEAFAQCSKLKKVIFGEELKTIGKKAFYNDGKLEMLYFKGIKFKKIKKAAFKNVGRVGIDLNGGDFKNISKKQKIKINEKYAKMIKKAKK